MSDSTEPEEDFYEPHEAIAAFRAMSGRERVNMNKAARFIVGTGKFIDPKELVSEAYVRMHDGDRRWRRGQSFLTFLVGTLRSLASTDVMFITEAKRARSLAQPLAAVTEDAMAEIPDSWTPETAWGKRLVDELVSRLEAHFEKDYEMRLLIVGIITDRLIGQELEEAVGVDTNRLATLRTRFNRQVDKIVSDIRGREGLSS